MLDVLLSVLLTIGGIGGLFIAKEKLFYFASIGLITAGLLTLISTMIITVPAGHVKVATMFGKVQEQYYEEGLHVVNPLLDFTEFDVRQKSYKLAVPVPAEDKLTTVMDVSVQFRTIRALTPQILRETGNTDALLEVHLMPKLRSVLREQGKGVKMSQDFFREDIQRQLQTSLQAALSEYLSPKGLSVENVLIRNVVLPKVITDSIELTKKREQQVLEQQAELKRFATEQEQKVKRAESEFNAAKLDAQKIKALADAEAYKIDVINKTLAKSPNYIELKRVEQWNGVLPVYAGGENIPMIDLRK